MNWLFNTPEFQTRINRRAFLSRAGVGLGSIALASLLRPDLASDPRYASNSRRRSAREALRRTIVDVFSSLTATEVLRRLDEARIASAQVNDMHDVWRHPQLAARRRWRDVASPSGPIPALLPPGTDDEAEPQWGAVPALGAHTDSILTALGYPAERIAELHADGAI